LLVLGKDKDYKPQKIEQVEICQALIGQAGTPIVGEWPIETRLRSEHRHMCSGDRETVGSTYTLYKEMKTNNEGKLLDGSLYRDS
jgi:hypothetical protein